ncbi:hypothetical protein [Aquitalea sp. ASV15]|uniref:hypothetical protein n=1 Tax=Aquitalea sp. ASV15 TaxID=2795104 RepID=UPI0018EC8497|nr:hypothetical protein [Aquitalea sp. ASV15]
MSAFSTESDSVAIHDGAVVAELSFSVLLLAAAVDAVLDSAAVLAAVVLTVAAIRLLLGRAD